MPQAMQRLVVVVSDGEVAARAASLAIADLAAGRANGQVSPAAGQPAGDAYAEVIRRARRFLDQAVPDDIFTVLTADSLAAVPDLIGRAVAGQPGVLQLLVLDHDDHRYHLTAPDDLHEELAKLALSLADSVEFDPGPHTVQVYSDPQLDARYCTERFTPRWMPDNGW